MHVREFACACVCAYVISSHMFLQLSRLSHPRTQKTIVAQLALISLGIPQTIRAQSQLARSLSLSHARWLRDSQSQSFVQQPAEQVNVRGACALGLQKSIKKKNTRTRVSFACSCVYRDSCCVVQLQLLCFVFLHIVCTLRGAWNITTTQPTSKRGMKSRRNNINTQAHAHTYIKCVRLCTSRHNSHIPPITQPLKTFYFKSFCAIFNTTIT